MGLGRFFESEQEYRCGCEYLFGTNGFGLRSEEFLKAQGLLHLKCSADYGHVDAQYLYAQFR
jgi:hypothetical protein